MSKIGDTTRILDVKPPRRKITRETNNMPQYLTSFESLKSDLKPLEIGIIVHLAALVGGDLSKVLRVNVDRTANLLSTLRLKKPKLIIIASTAAQLYGKPRCMSIDEKRPITPSQP